jgi:hypothetical protein
MVSEVLGKQIEPEEKHQNLKRAKTNIPVWKLFAFQTGV